MSWLSKTKEIGPFLRETRAELAKVSFPGREEVIKTTIVVVVTSVIFAAYLWVADRIILTAYQGIYRVFGA